MKIWRKGNLFAHLHACTSLYPTHIYIPILVFNPGPPPRSLHFRLCLCAPGVPQPRERIEGAAPRIALHALLEQSARLFFDPRAPFAPFVPREGDGDGEPDALGWGHEPCGGRGEDGGGDACGADVRERGAEGHLYSLSMGKRIKGGKGGGERDTRRGFRSIRRLWQRIVRCARRLLEALRLARRFAGGRGGRGRCLRGRGGGRCPVGGAGAI